MFRRNHSEPVKSKIYDRFIQCEISTSATRQKIVDILKSIHEIHDAPLSDKPQTTALFNELTPYFPNRFKLEKKMINNLDEVLNQARKNVDSVEKVIGDLVLKINLYLKGKDQESIKVSHQFEKLFASAGASLCALSSELSQAKQVTPSRNF